MELFVATFLTSLLMILLVSANLVVRKILGEWEKNNALYEDGRFILEQLSRDAGRAADIGFADNDTLIIRKNPSDSVIYEMVDGGLFKNSRRLNSPKVRCDSINVVTEYYDAVIADSIIVNNGSSVENRLVTFKIWLIYEEKEGCFVTSARLINENGLY
jgi:hypothetical protein